MLLTAAVANWRTKRASLFMSFEIRDVYINAPEILKWLRKTRGTQYASIHGRCVHANYRRAYFMKSRILASWLSGVAVSLLKKTA